jgi:DNA-binding CsgD family transcriptional regulator/ArsR family metal-binding transcriptional regulator
MESKKLIKSYSNLSFFTPEPLLRSGSLGDALMTARFTLDTDVSELFPYINTVVQGAFFYEKPLFIKFLLDGLLVALLPDRGAFAPFEEKSRAYAFMERLVNFLNDLYLRRNTIVPNHKKVRQVSVLDIFKLLPGTNCGECGMKTCMAFAAALSKLDAVTDQCPALNPPISERAVYPVLDEQGNIISTVTLDIDTSRTRQDIKKRLEYVSKLEKGLAGRTGDPPRAEGNESLPTPLTARELEVLRLLAQGATNNDISSLLDISPHTVKSHVIHIFNKLAVSDRTQAAVWATRNNLA